MKLILINDEGEELVSWDLGENENDNGKWDPMSQDSMDALAENISENYHHYWSQNQK